MATSAYYTWDNLGRPYKVAAPIRHMVAYAKANGIAILGTIGNEAHLTKSWPEDHTPYSYTAQPTKLPLSSGTDRYWVCACDLKNSKGLGGAILRDARAGRLPWLKYINVGYKHYVCSDGFKSGRDNPDEHIHLSSFSDELHTDISGYDPLGGTDMDALTEKNFKAIQTVLKRLGFYDGAIDADLGDKSQAALEKAWRQVGQQGPKGDPGKDGRTPSMITISMDGKVTDWS